MKRILSNVLSIMFVFSFYTSTYASECKDCVEVAKGKIPQQFLDKTVKELPAGIRIWDSPEAVTAVNDKTAQMLLVDTRPKSFYNNGTLKNAINLFYDQKGAQTPDSEKDIELTSESLKNAILKINTDISKVTVVFFCQGPECHRSYNAALRSIEEYGLQKTQVVWFRDGYPGLLDHINKDPKLSKKIGKYLQGKDVTE